MIKNLSLKLTLTYTVLAGLWIVVSDHALAAILPNISAATLNKLQTAKGLAFVVCNGGLLYLLVQRGLARVHEAALAQKTKDTLYRNILETSPNVIFMHCDGRIVFINKAGTAFFGAKHPSELEGRQVLDLLHPASREMLRPRIEELLAEGRALPRIQEKILRLDGSVADVDVVASAYEHEGRPAALVILRDMTAHRHTEARLSYLTLHDTLTDLPNKELLLDRLGQELIHARRAGKSVAVQVMELEGLEAVVGTYGYAAGDAIIQDTADCLQASVRPGDTVARLGGGRFAVILADLNSRGDVVAVSGKLHCSMTRSHAVAETVPFYATASSGIAIYPDDGEDAAAMLTNATAAALAARQSGGGAVEFYTQALSDASRDRMQIMQALRDAIDRQEFVLHYQPKVDAISGKVSACEALIRWNSPTLGAVSPARFIPIAEESGLILQIGDWVLREAVRQGLEWQRLGAVVTSVNLSPLRLRQAGYVATVVDLINRTGLDPACLTLELTESAIMKDVPKAIEVLSQLRGAGVGISLDDFGTGYSSFSQLRSLEVNELKIDRSFVRDIAESDKAASIVRTIINLGHNLGMKVVAEGVETAEQAQLLRHWRCDILQGWLFSPAVDVATFRRLLEKNTAYTW